MSTLSFPFPSIGVTDVATCWAHSPTTAFPGPGAVDDRTVVVQPIYGLANHGLGLPLDLEESVGADLLSNAVASWQGKLPINVLPALRFGLTPYGAKLGGLNPDELHRVIAELAASVKASGYRRLLFWSTSPWNTELIDAASRDARVNFGLQTFVIELAGLDLDLHPTSTSRATVQALAMKCLGVDPESATAPSSDDQDASFRPGRWTTSPAVTPDSTIPVDAVRAGAVRHLARLLGEVAQRAPLGGGGTVDFPPLPDDDLGAVASCYPTNRRSRYLPALTARQLAALPAKADALVIIPVGAIEQHGPHLPVAVDAMLAEAACQGLTARLSADDAVWFAPALLHGKSNEHADYPGTLTLSAQSLRAMVLALVGDLHAWGFRQFALLNTHGGNSAVLVYTLREIQTRFDVRAGMLKIPSTPELSDQESTWGFHAGEWETSAMLAIAPELVHMEKAICHYPAHLTDPGELRPENAPAIFSWMTRDIAPAGVMGDATAATVAKGERWLQVALDQLTAQIRQLLRR